MKVFLVLLLNIVNGSWLESLSEVSEVNKREWQGDEKWMNGDFSEIEVLNHSLAMCHNILSSQHMELCQNNIKGQH